MGGLLKPGSVKLRLWYGIVFQPPGQLYADRPPLPSWAEKLLDDGADSEDMAKALADRGYKGRSGELTWVSYNTSFLTRYYGLAAAGSIQACDGIGEVNTSLRDGQEEDWAIRIARALTILGVSAAKITWYQTYTVLP